MPDWSTIEFKWPFLLWATVIWPIWLGWRLWRWRRHHPILSRSPSSALVPRLFEAAALGILLLALARPQAVWVQPMREATVMLVIDTSASMRANDVHPNRLDAARSAARHFVANKPALLQVGIVAVGGTATLAQVPTLQRDDLFRALDELSWQNGSALGTGLIVALDALLPQAGLDVQNIIELGSSSTSAPPGLGPPTRAPPAAKSPLDPLRDPRDAPGPVGLSKAIVLITDGQGNMGPELLPMARWALKHQVRVYCIGVGTLQGAVVKDQGMSMRTRLEENVLREVAQLTAGEYRRAESAADLTRIHEDLGDRMRFEKRGVIEITHMMNLLGVLLALIAAGIGIARKGHMG